MEHRGRFSKDIASVLCIGLVFVVVTLVKFQYSHLLPSKTSGLSGNVREHNIDYLFMGSSLIRYSIDIRSYEEETLTSAYCLSYNGLRPDLAVELLDWLANTGDIRIGTVVMETYPYMVWGSFKLEDTRAFNDSPAEVKKRILKLLSSNASYGFASFYDLLVTEGNESMITYPITSSLIEYRSYKGGLAKGYLPGLESFRTETEPVPFDSTIASAGLRTDAFLRAIDICRKKGIRLVFLEPMLPGYVQNGKTYRFCKERIIEVLQAAGSSVLESSRVSMSSADPSLFYDAMHLSAKGREIWTREIVRILPSDTPSGGPR
jgi:hypothetical protein